MVKKDEAKIVKKREREIERLLKKLTLDEKITMIHGAALFASGGVERLGIPGIVCDDGPMGVRAEFMSDRWIPAGNQDDMVSYLPSNSALASSWNPELAREMGHVLGMEARGRGKDVILAPGINIKRDPRCGRNFEYMSEDPALTAALVVPFIKGVQENDVAACVKHFSANVQETGRLIVDETIDERTLYELYLLAFKAAVQEGQSYSIMAAYNKINGEYCCESKTLLDRILREEWGYDGAVISDWGGVHNTKEAAECSMDLEMSIFPDFDNYILANPLKELIQKGEVAESVVDAKVKNLLRMMYRLKMIGPEKVHREQGTYNAPSSREAILRTAEESMILLKNENRTLPLDAKKIKKLAVIGANAAKVHSDGGGSAEIKALYEICPLAGLKMYLGGNVKVEYAPGYYVPPKPKTFETNWQASSLDDLKNTTVGQAVRTALEDNTADHRRGDEERLAQIEKEKAEIHEKNKVLFEQALALAKEADAVIFVGGLNHDYDSEGFDRPDLKLPYEQDLLIEELLKVRQDAVITFVGGSPVEMPWRDRAQAILWSYYAGMETGNAFAKILFGEVNPSAKLAETFPEKYEDSATAKNGQFGIWEKITLEEGLYCGYRHYDRQRIKPAFCFGHGLSYTRFEYNDLKLKVEKGRDVKLTVSVKNTGRRTGAEIVQVYVAPISPKTDRPDKELKAFAKVKLSAGRTKKVNLTLKPEDFAYFDTDLHEFITDAGDYEILVGASCEDIRLRGIATLS
ncbi:MAG: glycoside hydrolase family 3 C-terminal domain-containing protein [Bacteroidales bacterium]|nr:glycoside hydrolase family 3 C-terminal domain-containing protein [Bacteroidales bacterium]MCM1416150.1 glycoside hydrolase family 3 C-terminal domain-containing protein [bacterium]MCM1422745.1 glycoside hydrolase family 3 C-terminal domain-containing protein [bacterium]